MRRWRHFDRIGVAVTVLMGAVLAVHLVLMGVRTWQSFRQPREARLHAEIIHALEVGLGFRAQTMDLRSRSYRTSSLLVVTGVAPGSALAGAGIRAGDAIRYPYADGFYKLLAFGRGSTVEVPVQRGRERLTVQIAVPRLDLDADPARVRWACPDSIVPGVSSSRVPSKPMGWQ